MYTYPEKEKIAVVNRYLNGGTISKISQTTKISRTTIYLWIKERNNSFNNGKAPNFRYLHDLQKKRQATKNYRNIATLAIFTERSAIQKIRSNQKPFRWIYRKYLMWSTESRERELLQPHTAQQKRKHESRKQKVRNVSCYRTDISRLQRNFREQ